MRVEDILLSSCSIRAILHVDGSLHESKYGATAASEYLAVAALDSAGWPAVDFVAVQATESVGSSAAALMETAASELIVMAIAAPNLVLVFAAVQIAIRSQFTYELLRGFQVRVVSESVELDNLSNRGSRFVAVLVLNIFNVPSRWMNFYRDIELLLYPGMWPPRPIQTAEGSAVKINLVDSFLRTRSKESAAESQQQALLEQTHLVLAIEKIL